MSDAGFEQVTPASRRAVSEPRLTVYADGSGRINAEAEERWFYGVDAVEIYVDADADRLGIALGGDVNDGAYAARTYDDGDKPGRKLALRSMLNAAGIEWTDIEESVPLGLSWDRDAGMLVADLTPVREAAG